MRYLEQYDRIPANRPQEKVAIVTRWIREEWRPFFKELREYRPIFQTPAFTLVTLFKDVQEILSRNEVFSVRLYAPKMDPVVGPFMLARDNTEFNYKEKSIMKTMLRLEDLPVVRAMAGRFADGSLDRWFESGRIEVVSQLGRLVPVRLCDKYFGFPGPNIETMFRWSKATQNDMFKNLKNDPDVHATSVTAGREMKLYLVNLLKHKRKSLAQEQLDVYKDVCTRLLATRYPKEISFDSERIITNTMGLLVGSVETTSQAIVQSLEQILTRPDVFERVLEAAKDGHEQKFDAYVWEALRFNPINTLVFRYCEADYTLAAKTERQTRIAANTVVFACTASASFDSTELSDPELFDSNRPPYHTMHFGHGEHSCLGKYVAMSVIPEVVRRVVLRPGVRLISGDEGRVDFQGGAFPEQFQIALGP